MKNPPKAIVPKIVKEIRVIEWFIKEKDGVYQYWELPTGEIIRRPTPYKESPVVA